MRGGGLTATLQAALMIAAISSLPESASARTCKCDCYGPVAEQGPERVDIDVDSKCKAANGRYCTLRNLDPAAPMSGRTRSISPVSGTTRNCSNR
jgi:hypothetical protein